MFSLLRRSTRLIRLRVVPSIASGDIAPSALTVLRNVPLFSDTRSVRPFSVSSAVLNNGNLPSNIDLSEHSPILDDTEHEAKIDEEGITRFQNLADLGIIDRDVIRNITEGMGYDEMTKVQRKTVTSTVSGAD